MAIIKGVWVFNETLSSKLPSDALVIFTSNNTEYFQMINSHNSYNGDMLVYEKTSGNGAPVYFFSDGRWAHEAYCTVDFGETEQEVSEEFYEWLNTNASPLIVYSIRSSSLTAIADAIRSKTGKTDSLTPAQMVTEIDSISASGGSGGDSSIGSNENALLARKLTSYTNSTATVLGDYALAGCFYLETVSLPAVKTIGVSAFAYCNYLTTASFPVATTIGPGAFYVDHRLTTVSFPLVSTIGSYAFCYCINLTTASFPAATSIGSHAFDGCDNLTTANFPAASIIGESAFYRCYSLTTVSFPAVTTIGSSAFCYCHSLATDSFPAVTTIGNSAFCYCDSLTTASFPVATSIGTHAFGHCDSLTTANFPVATTIGSYAFYSCSRLTTISFPAATTIDYGAFGHCQRLSSIYLMGASLCTLSNSKVFDSTPYTGYSSYFSGTPYIYVPASLLTSYQTASNWSYFSSYFSAIEDAEV